MARARTSYAGPQSTFMPGLLLMVVMLLLSVVGMASCSEAHSNMLLTASDSARSLCPLAEGGGMVDGQGMAGHRDRGVSSDGYIALVSDAHACEVRPGHTRGKTASWTLVDEADLSAMPSPITQSTHALLSLLCLPILSLYSHP